MSEDIEWPEELSFLTEFKALCQRYGCEYGAYLASYPGQTGPPNKMLFAIGGEPKAAEVVSRALGLAGNEVIRRALDIDEN